MLYSWPWLSLFLVALSYAMHFRLMDDFMFSHNGHMARRVYSKKHCSDKTGQALEPRVQPNFAQRW